MRFFLMVNNRLGLECTRHLVESGQEIAGAALHPPGRSSFGDDIRALTGLPDEHVFDGSRLRDPVVRGEISTSATPEESVWPTA